MRLCLTACLGVLLACGLSATTINSFWNASIGNWSTASDWNPSQVPNNGTNTYNVTINTPGSNSMVLLDTSPTVNSLSLGGSTGYAQLSDSVTSPETLTVAGRLTTGTYGLVYLNRSSLRAASVNNAGSIQLAGPGESMSVSGNVTNPGNINVNAGSILTIDGTLANTLVNGGNLNVGGTVNARNMSVGFSTVLPGGILNLKTGFSSIPNNNFLFVAGTINAGGSNTLAGLNAIQGELYLQNGKTTTITPGSNGLTNSGFLEAVNTGTTAKIVGSLSNQNYMNIGSGGTVIVTGAFQNGPTVKGGQLQVAGTLTANSFTNTGLATIATGGTLNLANGFTSISPGSQLTVQGSINSGGIAALNGLNTVAGNLDLFNGQSTLITPGGGTLINSSSFIVDEAVTGARSGAAIAGNFANSGSFYAQGSAVNITGSLTSDKNSVLGVDQSQLTVGGAFTSSGRMLEYIKGPAAGAGNACMGVSDCGFIEAKGPVHLSGILEPALYGSFKPTASENFIFMTFVPGELTGKFSSIDDEDFANEWKVTYGNDFVELTYGSPNPPSPTPEPKSLLLMGIGLGAVILLRVRHLSSTAATGAN